MKNNMLSKVTFTILALLAPASVFGVPPAPDVPDAGSSALLFTIGAIGIFAYRQFFGKAK